MNVLITGAAGNLGGFLARSLLDSPHRLRLMIHRRELPADLAAAPNVTICRADLARPETLADACRGVDCVVHFAGTLFAPHPEKFLPTTNVQYVRNLLAAAQARRFILISFPHVEGETFPDRRATDRLDGQPSSVHAQTRLAAEKEMFRVCSGGVALRAGMIYGRGVLMIDAARWLARQRLLGVWRTPTWIHLLSLPDFLQCCRAAIERDNVSGIYNLGDDQPLTLQEFLDAATAQWRLPRPWHAPDWSFYAAGAACEAWASVFGTASPLTRDFIRIGMASYCADTARMKRDLLPQLAYPTLKDGLPLL